LFFCALLAGCAGGAPRPPEALATAAEFEQRGSAMYDAGDYAGAVLQFERAFGQYGRLDRREAMLRNRIYAAQSALLINDLPRARSALDGLAELIDHPWIEHEATDGGETRRQRYRLRLLQSEYLIRSRQYTEAMGPLADIIDADDAPPEIRGSALINRARIAAATDAADRDLWLQRAQSSITAGLNQSRLLRLQASALSADGGHDRAEALLLRALENYRRVLFQPGIAATLGELGRLMEARHAPAEARFYFRRALALRLQLKDIPSAIELARRLQELETRAGAAAAAETYEKQGKELESMLTSHDSHL
jgi:tetratricopeptide (TPR) repeat protein